MKIKYLRPIAAVLVVGLAALQFYRPARNLGEPEGPDSIVRKHQVPEDVRAILRRSCYDCHSNRTTYPWYAEVQPVRLWLDSHVNDGKRHLNFSNFAKYEPKRAAHKLDEVVDALVGGSMPLKSYTLVHRDAVLSKAEIKLVTAWAEHLQDEIAP